MPLQQGLWASAPDVRTCLAENVSAVIVESELDISLPYVNKSTG